MKYLENPDLQKTGKLRVNLTMLFNAVIFEEIREMAFYTVLRFAKLSKANKPEMIYHPEAGLPAFRDVAVGLQR